MQLIDISYFNQANELFIPLAISVPNVESNEMPNEQAYLTNLIEKVQKELLINSLGFSLWKQIDEATELSDLSPEIQKLINGEEYNSKIWQGLKELIAYKVYEMFVTYTNSRLSAIGVTKLENSNFDANYKIANASQEFTNRYQKGYLTSPEVSLINGIEFIDYFGKGFESPEVSLWQYLNDKKTDLNWEENHFRYLEMQNSFGI